MLIHILRHYSVLFVGFSFRDSWINSTMEQLNKEREKRPEKDRLYHYAIMLRKSVEKKGKEFFENIGVKPIYIDSFCEIYTLVRDLYLSALGNDHKSGL